MPCHPVIPPGGPAGRGLEIPAEAGSLLVLLFPHLAGLEVSRVADAGNAVVVHALASGAQARWPSRQSAMGWQERPATGQA